ncbi:MAG: hypothetical protein LQ351_008056 [Letrouitia transgressa]|nr:MAG: hypothetical protein LQ351_008056 [Letrouitia transgressa]
MILQFIDQILELWRTDFSSVLLRKSAQRGDASVNTRDLLPFLNADTVINTIDKVHHFLHIMLRCEGTVARAFAIDTVRGSDREYKLSEIVGRIGASSSKYLALVQQNPVSLSLMSRIGESKTKATREDDEKRRLCEQTKRKSSRNVFAGII